MKTFIYFSQGEWRTFQAEELPIKPRIKDYVDMSLDLPSNEFYNDMQQYESEIAALKAKAIPVGNSEILEKVSLAEARIVETSVPILEWPGTVEVKKVQHCDEYHQHTKKSCYLSEAILKLPTTHQESSPPTPQQESES